MFIVKRKKKKRKIVIKKIKREGCGVIDILNKERGR